MSPTVTPIPARKASNSPSLASLARSDPAPSTTLVTSRTTPMICRTALPAASLSTSMRMPSPTSATASAATTLQRTSERNGSPVLTRHAGSSPTSHAPLRRRPSMLGQPDLLLELELPPQPDGRHGDHGQHPDPRLPDRRYRCAMLQVLTLDSVEQEHRPGDRDRRPAQRRIPDDHVDREIQRKRDEGEQEGPDQPEQEERESGIRAQCVADPGEQDGADHAGRDEDPRVPPVPGDRCEQQPDHNADDPAGYGAQEVVPEQGRHQLGANIEPGDKTDDRQHEEEQLDPDECDRDPEDQQEDAEKDVHDRSLFRYEMTHDRSVRTRETQGTPRSR